MPSYVKVILRTLLRRVGVDVKRLPPSEDRREWQWIKGGRIPWAPGYLIARERFIRRVLADPALVHAFDLGEALPASFGVGLDERCVEYPWTLSRLRRLSGSVLDAGSTLNHAFLVEHPALADKRLYILSLAPEAQCFWQRGISYLYNDLRALPMRDGFYDAIVCISTLEHVGWDNSPYTGRAGHRQQQPEDYVVAMQELWRVLRPGGTLLLTVPYGRYQRFRTFQQFDRTVLARAVEAFGPAEHVDERYYRYTATGWARSDAPGCAEAEYVPWTVTEALQSVPFPVQPDGAAAARAVACVALVKHS